MAQIKTAATSASAPRFGAAQVSRYRVGASIRAGRGAVQKVRAMVAVPYPCDEQQVEVVDEDISEQVDSMTYRDLPGGARQMLIAIGRLPAGEEAHAIITFEVRTRPILPRANGGPGDSTRPHARIETIPRSESLHRGGPSQNPHRGCRSAGRAR